MGCDVGVLRTIQAPRDHEYVNSVHFHPTDRSTLASSGSTIRIWNIDSGDVIRSFDGSFLALFSPDGLTIATAVLDDGHDVLLLNAESGELRLRLVHQVVHPECVNAFSFISNDESKLASGDSEGTCTVWDSSTGALLRTIHLVPGGAIDSVGWGNFLSLSQKLNPKS